MSLDRTNRATTPIPTMQAREFTVYRVGARESATKVVARTPSRAAELYSENLPQDVLGGPLSEITEREFGIIVEHGRDAWSFSFGVTVHCSLTPLESTVDSW